MRRSALAALVLLAACSQPSDQPAPAPSTPISLVGEYRVAGIDGAPLEGPEGIALTITEGKVSFEPTCAGNVWSYAYREGVLDIERRQEKLQHPPPPPCPVPHDPVKIQLASALDAVSHADRTPSNGIELSGHGRSVLLFTQ